jgi:hypothetical protein
VAWNLNDWHQDEVQGNDDPNTASELYLGCDALTFTVLFRGYFGLSSCTVAVATTTDEPADIDLKYERNCFGSGAL